MSDADTVRFYLDKRDDLAGWLALARLESQNQALQEALKEADRNIAAIRKAADGPAFSHEFVGKVTRSVLAGPPTETQQQILARLSLTVEADSE